MRTLFGNIKTHLRIFVVAYFSLFSFQATSAEMLMLEQTGCYWCAKWHKEIGPIYSKTDEAKVAPLRKVDINKTWPKDLKNIKKDQFTPTFIITHDGKEIGRMRGYAGDEFFWSVLNEILNKIPSAKSHKG